MNITGTHLEIAARLYECRAAARSILGDKYHQRMEERADVVKAVAKRDNCNDITAATAVIKECGLEGLDAILMLAAVVEMTEPSIPSIGERTWVYSTSN